MKRQDRRIQRTQQLLEAALLSLIKEKDFDAISVQEIIDLANVSQATFYALRQQGGFVREWFRGLLAALRERQREARSRGSGPDEQLLGFSRHLLAHADEHRDIFPAMVSKRGGALIQHLLRNLLVKEVREDVKEVVAVKGSAKSVSEESVVQFIAGGLFGLMMWWLGGKRRLSVDEVGTLFRQLAIPALKAAAS